MGIQIDREEVERTIVEKLAKQLHLECDMCGKAASYGLGDHCFAEPMDLQIDKFGIVVRQRCGYYTPYDCHDVEFVICWDCFKSKVHGAKITSQFEH